MSRREREKEEEGIIIHLAYLARNQHTRELISARKTSHKHSNKDSSPTVILTWHASKYKIHKLHQGYMLVRTRRTSDVLTLGV